MKTNFCAFNHGFTLKELLISIVLLAVLMSASIPVFQAMSQKSKQAKCLNNMRQIGILTQQYVSENANRIFPDARLLQGGNAENPNDVHGRWIGVMNEMLGRPTTMGSSGDLRGPELPILVCPADRTKGGWNIHGAANGISGNVPQRDGIRARSYAPNRLMLGQRVTNIPQPSKAILFSELDWSQTGTRSIYPHTARWMALIPRQWHLNHAQILFVDGHVEQVLVDDLMLGGRLQNAWYRNYDQPDLSYQ